MPLWHHWAFWNIQDGVQDGRQLGSLGLYDQNTWSKAFYFWLFMDISEAKCSNQLKWNIILIQKVEILKMASKMAVS